MTYRNDDPPDEPKEPYYLHYLEDDGNEETKPLTERLQIRLTTLEKETLKKTAARIGISASKLIRVLIMRQ
jgi:predicted HicB family RNase H-like nuclease